MQSARHDGSQLAKTAVAADAQPRIRTLYKGSNRFAINVCKNNRHHLEAAVEADYPSFYGGPASIKGLGDRPFGLLFNATPTSS